MKIKHWNPVLHRLIGFRTTGGIDANMTEFSVSNLFVPNSDFSYCSSISPNVNVTGIIINEDM